ncbi:MAG: nucleoside hydrolase [Anaerolineaceae bacterium]|nr:MAG: nucleoside hydrolase [Anaerolineaceae bacterium]
MYRFQVPDSMKFRVIIDTDAKNEADDQFAIAHALLTPRFMVKGIIATHFGKHRTEESMEESYQECIKVLELMDMAGQVDILRSSREAVKSETDYEYTEGAQRIVDEALSDDPHRLFVVFLGPLTNLACAYLKNPEIAGRLTAIWIGGGVYPDGGKEFNLSNDILAANIVMKSGIDLWQVPCNVYTKMKTSLTELQDKVYPYGKIGKYLFEQMAEFNHIAATVGVEWFGGESWSLGDSPAIGLMMNPHEYSYTLMEAPFIDSEMKYHFDGKGRKIRVYHEIDSRFILEDMFVKLRLNYPQNECC